MVSQCEGSITLGDDDTSQASDRLLATPRSHPKNNSISSQRKKPLIHDPRLHPNEQIALFGHSQAFQESTKGNSELLAIEGTSRALASDIARTDYQSKEDLEVAIQAGILNLLTNNKSRKRIHEDSAHVAIDSKQLDLTCPVCHKVKKTHCDLR